MDTRALHQRRFLQSIRRIVIKIGSAVLTDQKGLDTRIIEDLCSQVACLKNGNREVTLVSSGAIAAGMGKMLELTSPKTVPDKQALAAIGQGRLMQVYEEAFEKFGLRIAQILITREGLVSRHRYVNAKNTLKTLLQWGVIPIVNENDTVSTEELQFTDNDALAVLIVNLVEAEALICLSDVDGLYDRDPREDPDAHRIPEVYKIDQSVIGLASENHGRAGRGGMKSKIEAARMLTACGVPMVIAGGHTEGVLKRLFSGEDLGTIFYPGERRRIYGRKPWIAFTLARQGSVDIDRGAAKAILEQGKSLLPVGVKRVEGNFDAGACIVVRNGSGEEIAVGLTGYSSQDLSRICGCHTGEIYDRLGYQGVIEVIHRDNMVIL